ncbi:MAG: pilus assembly protein CpaC [Rhizobiales bacterium]|nr:pilus assembly protein CpaC [Hyphomicrobiales bacterium]
MRMLSCVRPLAVCVVAALGVFGPLFGSAGAARATDINVILDQARLVKLPDRVATIVIGNPAIADAAIQNGGWMIITGKGYGATNIIALDRGGAILMERTVDVQGPRDVVVVYRGADRDTLSCTPECERRLTLGDANAIFDVTASQIGTRNGLAAGTAASR